MTYSEAEFYPGPHMNMVIGPNGTGKSTIVCAIALGMAGKPEVLGRSKDLSDFIKQGEENAMVEIEVKDDPNQIVQRFLKRGVKSSEYKLNGKKVSESSVKQQLTKFNIQVDNLCQFLPQDRVASFAQMDTVKLLHETERAAGNNLLETHQKLIVEQGKEVILKQKNEKLQEAIETLQKKNELYQRDVDRLNEKEEIEKSIRRYEAQEMIIKVNLDINRYRDQKNALDVLKQQYAELEKKNHPMLEKKNALKIIIKKKEDEAQAKKLEYDRAIEQSNHLTTKLNENQDMEQIKNQIRALKKDESMRESTIADFQTKVDQARQRYDRLKDDMFEKGLCGPNGERVEKPKAVMEIETELSILDDNIKESLRRINVDNQEMQQQQQEIARTRDDIRRKNHELHQLDNIKNQRLNVVRQRHRETADVIEWLRQNQHEFQQRIIEPACVELEIKDNRFSKHVEQLINRSDWLTFLTTNKSDYAKFKDLIRSRFRNINVACIDRPLEHFLEQQRFSSDEVRKMGMDCFAIDVVDGPPPLLAHLCGASRLHQIPIALNELSEQVENTVKDKIGNGVYVHGNNQYRVREGYGQKSTRVDRLREPMFLVASVDLVRKGLLTEQIQTLNSAMSEYESKINSMRQLMDRKSKSLEKQKLERKELSDKIKVFKDSYSHLNSALRLMESAQQTLERARQRPSKIPEIQRMEEKLEGVKASRVNTIKKLLQVQKNLLQLFEDRNICMLGALKSLMEMQELEEVMVQSAEQLKVCRLEVEQSQHLLKELKALAKTSNQRMEQFKQENPELEFVFDEPVEMTLEEIRNALAQERAKSELAAEIDPNILLQYEANNKSIDGYQVQMNGLNQELEELMNTMGPVRDAWMKDLNDVIDKISESFSKAFNAIGCSGHVKINTEGGFEHWGIEIWVKFRDEESHQRLNANRQSGGERSVSTMLYLLSLQDLSASPFRVVDEINQGMDPRNERLVHKLIVGAACNTGKSQYFLITPKLLPDLEFHERMRVLCVFNGTWQPEKWTHTVKDRLRKRIL
ncbi:hypothetical protein EDD86DRAFT_205257 [Gorgonomyces haynaldii]|nr:hypothetical protein EDD86DRAFT_205257 [Gorgonomyces haynaldii]